MRTLARAVETTLADPGGWALAAAGFLARGGAILFAGVLLDLPSPITVTLIFGLDSVTGTGDPTARLVVVIGAIGVGILGAVVVGLVIGAWVDLAAFARVDAGAGPSQLGTPTRRTTAPGALGLAWLQALGLLPGIAVLALALPTVRDVAVGELLLPTSSTVPFLIRVLVGAQGALLRGIVVLGAGEALVTIATRLFLQESGGASRGASGGATFDAYVAAFGWIVRRPVAAVGSWLIGWIVLLGALAVGLGAVALAWNEVRTVLLDAPLQLAPLRLAPLVGSCPDPASCGDALGVLRTLSGAVGASLLFITVWIAGIVLVGLASAFRSALWTLAVRAGPARATVVEAHADASA